MTGSLDAVLKMRRAEVCQAIRTSNMTDTAKKLALRAVLKLTGKMIKDEGRLTFTNFFRICRSMSIEIGEMKFEASGFKGKIEAALRLRGTYAEVSEKLIKLTEKLKPFIDDEYCGKWLNVDGTMDLHNFSGYLDINVGFRGMSIELE